MSFICLRVTSGCLAKAIHVQSRSRYSPCGRSNSSGFLDLRERETTEEQRYVRLQHGRTRERYFLSFYFLLFLSLTLFLSLSFFHEKKDDSFSCFCVTTASDCNVSTDLSIRSYGRFNPYTDSLGCSSMAIHSLHVYSFV